MRYHTKNHHLDTFFIYGISVCLVVILSIVGFLSPKTTNPIVSVFEPEKEAKAFFNRNAFSDIQVQAKAYVIYDITTNEIIASKNETALLPLASITKVMTAISSTSHKDKGEKISINPASIEDSYDLGLKKNQVWSLGELLKYTLVFSSNDGAQAISDSFGGNSIFVVQMITDAKSLGLPITISK